MKEDFLKTLATALEVNPEVLDEKYTLAYANWDSLMAMTTIAAVDQHFDIVLGPDELFACSSVKDLLELIRSKGAQL